MRQERAVGVHRQAVVVEDLVAVHEIGHAAQREVEDAQRGRDAAAELGRGDTHDLIGRLAVIVGRNASGHPAVFVIDDLLPYGIAVARIDAQPFGHVPTVNVLPHLHLLRDGSVAAARLEESLGSRRSQHAVAVEPDVESRGPRHVAGLHVGRIERDLETAVADLARIGRLVEEARRRRQRHVEQQLGVDDVVEVESEVDPAEERSVETHAGHVGRLPAQIGIGLADGNGRHLVVVFRGKRIGVEVEVRPDRRVTRFAVAGAQLEQIEPCGVPEPVLVADDPRSGHRWVRTSSWRRRGTTP